MEKNQKRTLAIDDFAEYERDVVQSGLSKMLAVTTDKCVLRQFFAAFLHQVQELYNVALDVEQQRTIETSQGVNLDALGRIVGAKRIVETYSEESWFIFDVEGNGFDQMPWWVTGGSLNVEQEVFDEAYRSLIKLQVIKNHTLCASIPETLSFIKKMFGLDVSFEKIGPMSVRVTAQWDSSKDFVKKLTTVQNTLAFDDEFFLAYPVTLQVDKKVQYIKKEGFYFDRPSPHMWDEANWSIIG